MIGSLLTFFAVGLVTLIVAGIVLSIVGTVFSLTFGLATFLLFKVAPILLVGWIVVKAQSKDKDAIMEIFQAGRLPPMPESDQGDSPDASPEEDPYEIY